MKKEKSGSWTSSQWYSDTRLDDVPRYWNPENGIPGTHLAYITKQESDILQDTLELISYLGPKNVPFYAEKGLKSVNTQAGGETADNLPAEWKSSKEHPLAQLAYLTDDQAELLKMLDIHKSGVDKHDHYGPRNVPSYQGDGGGGGDVGGGVSGMGYDYGIYDPNAEALEAERLKKEHEAFLASPAGNVYKQILAQGTTGRWTGQGFGGPEANAKAIANTLYGAGITDIKDFGQIKKTTYTQGPVTSESNPANIRYGERTEGSWGADQAPYTVQYSYEEIPTETIVYGNKKTGQAIDPNYNRAEGNVFSGTYAGHGRTNFGVQFAGEGTPYFYTQFGGDTSSIGDFAPIIAILSVIPTPLQPFAMAANALIQLDNGNTLGALAGLAGIPGVSEAAGAAGLGSVVSGIQTANQVVNLANAIESGNVLGIVASTAGLTGTGSTVIGDTGLTVSDAVKSANLINAIGSNNPLAIINAATSFASSPTIRNSLNSPSTTLDASGEKVADIVGDNFVAELVNPDSSNYLGGAEETLNNLINGPSAQVASTDEESVIKAIENLRNPNVSKVDQGSINTNVVQGEDGSQLVYDQDGTLVDIIPAPEQPETPSPTEFQGPMGPMTEDKIKRYNEEFANYLDYLQAGQPLSPNYGVQDLGITPENWESFNQNLLSMQEKGQLPSQWKLGEGGNYTFTSDDGSTMTIDQSGNIAGYTEAPAGNMLGETPATTPSKPSGGGSSKPSTSQPTGSGAKSGIDLNALFSAMGMMGAAAQGQNASGIPQTNQEVYAKMPEFDVTKAFSPTLYAERQKNQQSKTENPYLSGLIEEVKNV
jgi:hypothetical protein